MDAVSGRGLSIGARYASPLVIFLLLGFLAPLVTVVAFAFAEPKSFEVFRTFTLENFAAVLDPSNTVWRSFVWSLVLAALCVAVLAVIAYPIAYGLNRVFGRFAPLISVLFVFPRSSRRTCGYTAGCSSSLRTACSTACLRRSIWAARPMCSTARD